MPPAPGNRHGKLFLILSLIYSMRQWAIVVSDFFLFVKI